MILKILTEPNPLLHLEARAMSDKEITSAETRDFAESLTQTMYAKDGVGLAAPQVGKSLRMFVVAKEFANGAERDLILINPSWEKIGNAKEWDEEGCLSVPLIYGLVKRYKKIRVTAKNLLGHVVEFEAVDLFARIIQHETDHLLGILFIEKAKKLRKIKPDEKIKRQV